MHILSANRQRIELDLVGTAPRPVEGRLAATADDARPGGERVEQANMAFFEMRPAPTVRAAAARGPRPDVFRDRRTGLLRVVYKEIVLRFRRGVPVARRRAIIAHHGFRLRERNAIVADQVVVYDPTGKRSGAPLLDIANDWAAMEEVVFATPNFVSQFRRAAPRAIHREQWHLHNARRYTGQKKGEDVDARAAWKVTTGKRSIVVAVLDDGVDVDHPNLKPNVRRKPDPKEKRDLVGRDFFIPKADHPGRFNPRPKRFRFPFDQMEGNDIHGTPCAGVIAASGRNGGAVGIAPNCRILAVKIFHADDLASDARVADAIRYAALHADILSCSWGTSFSPDIELAIHDAGTLGRKGKGAAVFCAAGNEYGDPVGFPGALPEAIAVGASTDRGRLADYSNVGPEIWVVAPSDGGVRGIFTTDVGVTDRGFNIGKEEAGGKDGLHTIDFGGTSSATPLAAGVGALVLSVKPSLDRAELAGVLAVTADKIGSGYNAQGRSKKFGHGRVNAARAVESVA
jgi:subtilisin family serine protease